MQEIVLEFAALAPLCALRAAERNALQNVGGISIIAHVAVFVRLARAVHHAVNQLRILHALVLPQVECQRAGNRVDFSDVYLLGRAVKHVVDAHNALAVQHPEISQDMA